MAYDGELVKMQNGRWARFQRCQVYRPGVTDAGETMLLIAVELEERYQQLLDDAADSLAEYRSQGVQVRLAPDAQGLSLQPEASVSVSVN
ncbi:hypothetical protein D7Y13_22015 [Corallococcus praedator]|uniref:Uncharacterized protein n=1 Tax=Corallococcus praedator TaxID=2316724 RepID=A0ABX9QE90_9BACT|nr:MULTISPECIES: hypothetical protein [Corallococcus]RKH04622.1 hypothetical protein D7X74_35220 [Corallococcus sp. CA047B]RKH22122.1 hypothetical protein D7X75_36060 [Corallococcus sp. CA031C]RKI05631.1 hypothetical protein D7Y13_22015 [Corallococcus praedator]